MHGIQRSARGWSETSRLSQRAASVHSMSGTVCGVRGLYEGPAGGVRVTR
ncbi:Uncharacterised protein [Mycobacterium tuberculosis]|nr:Uncharacterised protein [Mycobacterium tuberculosis]